MKTDDFDIEQPENDKSLFRYMDKWKFDSILALKFVFTNAINQEDPYDCYNPYKKSGFVTVDNMERKFTLLSCWTLDDTYTEDKVLKYCRFRDKEDENDCESAYVIETTYGKLIEFIKMQYDDIEGLITVHTVPYIIRYGIVKYLDVESIKGTVCEGLHNSCFLKNKSTYIDENEFRIIAKCGASKNPKPNVIWLQGNPKDFLVDVYEFNRKTGEFIQTGIPPAYGETKKPSMYESTKIK